MRWNSINSHPFMRFSSNFKICMQFLRGHFERGSALWPSIGPLRWHGCMVVSQIFAFEDFSSFAFFAMSLFSAISSWFDNILNIKWNQKLTIKWRHHLIFSSNQSRYLDYIKPLTQTTTLTYKCIVQTKFWIKQSVIIDIS